MSGLIRAIDPNGTPQNLVCDSSKQLKVAVSGAGSGGTSTLIGDPVAGQAGTIAGFKDVSGNMAPANLDAGGNLKIAGTLSTTPTAASTPALTNVPESATSVTLLAANASRLAFELYNDSDGVLLVKPGTTASATSFAWRVMPRSALSTLDIGVNYTGRLDGIWETAPATSGHAAARVTELTA